MKLARHASIFHKRALCLFVPIVMTSTPLERVYSLVTFKRKENRIQDRNNFNIIIISCPSTTTPRQKRTQLPTHHNQATRGQGSSTTCLARPTEVRARHPLCLLIQQPRKAFGHPVRSRLLFCISLFPRNGPRNSIELGVVLTHASLLVRAQAQR